MHNRYLLKTNYYCKIRIFKLTQNRYLLKTNYCCTIRMFKLMHNRYFIGAKYNQSRGCESSEISAACIKRPKDL